MRVVEVFDSIQGEGVWAGTPMTFVRLAGCNALDMGLACVTWCDTRYAWDSPGGREVDPIELANQVRLPRCCVTGGEPLLQQDELILFAEEAHRRGVRVHLETNGTVSPRPDLLLDWMTVSPKPPLYQVAAGVAEKAAEVKVILDDGLAALAASEISRFLRVIAGQFSGKVLCIQPEAASGLERARLAARLALDNPDWRLSLQLHRILGLK